MSFQDQVKADVDAIFAQAEVTSTAFYKASSSGVEGEVTIILTRGASLSLDSLAGSLGEEATAIIRVSELKTKIGKSRPETNDQITTDKDTDSEMIWFVERIISGNTAMWRVALMGEKRLRI